jgi:hypothetical protein
MVEGALQQAGFEVRSARVVPASLEDVFIAQLATEARS